MRAMRRRDRDAMRGGGGVRVVSRVAIESPTDVFDETVFKIPGQVRDRRTPGLMFSQLGCVFRKSAKASLLHTLTHQRLKLRQNQRTNQKVVASPSRRPCSKIPSLRYLNQS